MSDPSLSIFPYIKCWKNKQVDVMIKCETNKKGKTIINVLVSLIIAKDNKKKLNIVGACLLDHLTSEMVN